MVHRCVIESVVMWLHISVGPCWCVYVALNFSHLIKMLQQKWHFRHVFVHGLKIWRQ